MRAGDWKYIISHGLKGLTPIIKITSTVKKKCVANAFYKSMSRVYALFGNVRFTDELGRSNKEACNSQNQNAGNLNVPRILSTKSIRP